MKRIVLILPLLFSAPIHAAPSSDIAWTAEQLRFVKNGNPEKGKVLAESCASCHGDQGQGTPGDEGSQAAYPALAGQVPAYTFKQLRDYAREQRTDPIMNALVKSLSEQDAADLAAWFGSLPKPRPSGNKANLAKAEKMVSEGDGKRILPPCSVCHGANGQGEKMDIPALAGQQGEYFVKTLLDYKSGVRHNDVYARMRLIAQQLSDVEIKELARYYQGLD